MDQVNPNSNSRSEFESTISNYNTKEINKKK